MDELTRYVINYYRHLMTPEEYSGWKVAITRPKLAGCESPAVTERLKRLCRASDAVLALLADGDEAFFLRVRERILREHPGEVFLNYCTKCGALARTPAAKQCPKCFHDWHPDAEYWSES